MSLEISWSKQQLQIMKRSDQQFRLGWLKDEVIDAYLFLLSVEYRKIHYCGSTEAKALSLSKSINMMWRDTNLDIIECIFIQFNPSGSHFMLVIMFIPEQTIVVLDPLVSSKYSIPLAAAVQVGRELFSRKFRTHKTNVINIDHELHEHGDIVVVLIYVIMRN